MDYVEEAWRIVDPVLTMKTPVREYEPGTWGPAEAASARRTGRRMGEPDDAKRKWRRMPDGRQKEPTTIR